MRVLQSPYGRKLTGREIQTEALPNIEVSCVLLLVVIHPDSRIALTRLSAIVVDPDKSHPCCVPYHLSKWWKSVHFPLPIPPL